MASFSTVLTAFMLLKVVCCDYVLEIRAHSYRNSESKNSNGGCCDLLCGQCENRFVFCLRHNGTEQDGNADNCPRGRYATGVIGGDNFSFGTPITSGVPNPMTFEGNLWPGAVQLYIEVVDVDLGADDHVDDIYIQQEIPIGPDFTDTMMFSGVYGNSEIELSFRLQCVNASYGPDCATYCIYTDSEDGHYSCSSSGAKVCLDGWSNPTGNCLTRSSFTSNPASYNGTVKFCPEATPLVNITCTQGWSSPGDNPQSRWRACSDESCTVETCRSDVIVHSNGQPLETICKRDTINVFAIDAYFCNTTMGSVYSSIACVSTSDILNGTIIQCYRSEAFESTFLVGELKLLHYIAESYCPNATVSTTTTSELVPDATAMTIATSALHKATAVGITFIVTFTAMLTAGVLGMILTYYLTKYKHQQQCQHGLQDTAGSTSTAGPVYDVVGPGEKFEMGENAAYGPSRK